MAWLYLAFAILFEIGWVTSLKFTEGYTRPVPIAINIIMAIGTTITLSKTVKIIPVSLAYPIWVGVSMIGIVLLNVFFGENITFRHAIFAGLILIGAVGLKTL